MNTRIILSALLITLLAACSSAPEPNETLERARRDFTAAQRSSQVTTLAADELRAAEQSLRVAETAYAEGDIPVNVDHLAYLSIQYTAIAREVASTRSAQSVTAGAATERDRILAEVRANQAAAAQRTITRTPLTNTQGNSDRAAVQAQATAAQQELARMIQESAQNEAERAAVQAQAAAAQQQLARLVEASARSEAERATAQAQATAAQQQLERLAQDSARSDAERAAAQAQATEAQEQLQRTKEESFRFYVERAAAVMQTQEAEEQLQLLQEETARSNTERAAALEQTVRVEQQLARLQQENARSDAERAEALAQTTRVEQQLARMQEDIARSEAAAAAAQSQALAAQQQLANLIEENARTAEQLAIANAAIAAAAQRETVRAATNDARAVDIESQLRNLNARPGPRGMVLTFGDGLFDSGQSRLLPGAASNLQPLATFLTSNSFQRATIEGYTDSVGDAGNNYILSQRRADAVMAELITMGVRPSQLESRAFGAENPIASNDTEPGRRANRRVEVVFAP